MPPIALDRSRPFATVCGGSAAWSYEQDGKRFDAQDWEVVDIEGEGKDAGAPGEGAKKRKARP